MADVNLHIVDLPALKQLVERAAQERERVLQDIEAWQRAAFLPVRVRRAIVARLQAGEPADAVASDYEVPLAFVETIGQRGYDVDIPGGSS